METPVHYFSISEIHHYVQQELANHPMGSRVLCGAVAGVVAKTAIAPAEKVKMSFQISVAKFSLWKALIRGKEMLIKDGFFSLWKGHGTTVVRVAPFAGLNFACHDYTELKLKHYLRVEQLPFAYKFLAGSVAGSFATICTYPLDVLRVRLALIPGSTWASAIRQGGLYQGVLPTLLGIVPYSGTIWCVKQSLQETMSRIRGRPLTSLEAIILNGIAGICGQFVSYPLDVIRRRMQMIIVTKGEKAPTMRSVLFHLLRYEGPQALLKGFSMNLIKGPLSLSISLTTYDSLRSWVNAETTQLKNKKSL